MDDNSRVIRRSRPRPYDLRRKVLLKNFLREQMTFTPLPRETSDSSNETDSVSSFLQDSSSINAGENLESEHESEAVMQSIENSLQPPSLSEANDTAFDSLNNGVSKSKEINQEVNIVKPRVSKFSRFSTLMRLRSKSTGKKNNKGVFKAKHVCSSVKSPGKSKPTKRNFEKLFGKNVKCDENSKSALVDKLPDKRRSEASTSDKSPSFFSIFKSLKANKKRCKEDVICNPSIGHSPLCQSVQTSSQSVQTDLSWSEEKISDVEETNRLLLEENKLLSQSLSYFMSNNSKNDTLPSKQDTNFESHFSPGKESVGFLSSYENFVPKETASVSSSVLNKWPQVKISRSKSVQEHSDRKFNKCHRTKSMNHHPSFRDSLRSNRVTSSESHNSSNLFTPDFDYRKLRFPRSKPKVLRTLSVNSSGRTIHRRSSMPERTDVENIRSSMCRRSGSMHSYDRKRPAILFHALPAEAFY